VAVSGKQNDFHGSLLFVFYRPGTMHLTSRPFSVILSYLSSILLSCSLSSWAYSLSVSFEPLILRVARFFFQVLFCPPSISLSMDVEC